MSRSRTSSLLGGAVLAATLAACTSGGTPTTTSASTSPSTSTSSAGSTSGSSAASTSSSTSPSSTPTSSSYSAATESAPPGDIPDNQAFVPFSGTGFTVKIPEGWSRTSTASGTVFTDKLNAITVTESTSSGFSKAQAEAELMGLAGSVPAFAPGTVAEVTRPAGPAFLLTYQGDSAPNPVTGKVVRDALERYVFVTGTKRVDVVLSGPVSADNVDPWRIVTDSFRWTP